MSSPTGGSTPELVSSALARAFPGIDLSSCRSEPIVDSRGVASSFLRIRLVGAAPPVPTSVVVKCAPDHEATRALLHAMGFFEREVHFYRALAATTPVATPECYLAELDRVSGQAILLLEDLSSSRNGDTSAGATVHEVAEVLDVLARLHARWWQQDEVTDSTWSRLPSLLAPTAVSEAFERAWPSFLGKLGVPPDDDIRAAKSWISATLETVSTALFETGPRTLVHNDVQPDNLFFGRDPRRRVVFVDWQMVTYGRCVVDVASAIRGMLDVRSRITAEPALLRAYHHRLTEEGVHDYSFERCQADYSLATVLAPARLATAVGLHDALVAHAGAAWDVMFPRLVARP